MFESAFAVAVNDHPMSVASARQQSHDTVIRNAGPDRGSGVTWTQLPVAAATTVLAASSDIVLPDDALAVMAQFPDGILVIATVEVKA